MVNRKNFKSFFLSLLIIYIENREKPKFDNDLSISESNEQQEHNLWVKYQILGKPIIDNLVYNSGPFTEIMQMIWKRLNDHGKNWRHVYKALVLLEYLIKTGSEKVRVELEGDA